MIDKIGLSPTFFQTQSKEKLDGLKTPHEAQQSFSTMLRKAINQVNEAQIHADDLTEKLINHEIHDLHEVMIAAEKASITLQLSLEMRNKMIEAYQEIMRMQL